MTGGRSAMRYARNNSGSKLEVEAGAGAPSAIAGGVSWLKDDDPLATGDCSMLSTRSFPTDYLVSKLLFPLSLVQYLGLDQEVDSAKFSEISEGGRKAVVRW